MLVQVFWWFSFIGFYSGFMMFFSIRFCVGFVVFVFFGSPKRHRLTRTCRRLSWMVPRDFRGSLIKAGTSLRPLVFGLVKKAPRCFFG